MPFISSIRGNYSAVGAKGAIGRKNDNLLKLNITGGTITTAGGYRIHTFTSPGTLNTSGYGSVLGGVEYLVVASGGMGSPGAIGSGGGAGGLLNGTESLPATSYGITVGPAPSRGPPGNLGPVSNGSNSVYNGKTAIGGGAGVPDNNGNPGGSGGGGNGRTASFTAGGGTPGQGNPGGNGNSSNPATRGGGGGGGAGAAGVSGTSGGDGGAGGAGLQIFGTYYAGGGGGASENSFPTAVSPTVQGGGIGGGGNGRQPGGGDDGAPGTGGGGGAGGYVTAQAPSGAGGSGIVIVRYPYSA